MNEEEFFDALEYAFKNEEVCRGGERGMVSWQCGTSSIAYVTEWCVRPSVHGSKVTLSPPVSTHRKW